MTIKNPRVPKYRIALVREKVLTVDYGGTQIPVSTKAAAICREIVSDVDRENLVVLTLDNKNKIIGVNVVSVGTINMTLAQPREILKLAILQNASSIIMGHNHPSGDPTPSTEDREAYHRLDDACRLLGIKLLDGIILGDEAYWSMTDKGVSRYAAINTIV